MPASCVFEQDPKENEDGLHRQCFRDEAERFSSVDSNRGTTMPRSKAMPPREKAQPISPAAACESCGYAALAAKVQTHAHVDCIWIIGGDAVSS